MTVCREHLPEAGPLGPDGLPTGYTVEAGWSDHRSPVACPWCPMLPDNLLVSRPSAHPDPNGGTWVVTVAARYRYTPIDTIVITTPSGKPTSLAQIDDAVATLLDRWGPLPVDRRTQGGIGEAENS